MSGMQRAVAHALQELFEMVTEHTRREARLSVILAGVCLLIPGYLGACLLYLLPAAFELFVAGAAESLLGYHDWERWLALIAATTLPTFLFFSWNPSLLRGQTIAPKRTYFLVAIVVAFAGYFLFATWSDGLREQGLEYTLFVDGIELAGMAALTALCFRCWKGRPSFIANVALHWVLFAWLACCAVPLLGRMDM
jgi:hypothetical protein